MARLDEYSDDAFASLLAAVPEEYREQLIEKRKDKPEPMTYPEGYKRSDGAPGAGAAYARIRTAPMCWMTFRAPQRRRASRDALGARRGAAHRFRVVEHYRGRHTSRSSRNRVEAGRTDARPFGRRSFLGHPSTRVEEAPVQGVSSQARTPCTWRSAG